MQIRSRNGSCSHEPITKRVGKSPVRCTSLLQQTSLPAPIPRLLRNGHMSKQSTLARQWKHTRHPRVAAPKPLPHPASRFASRRPSKLPPPPFPVMLLLSDHSPPLPARSSLVPQPARRPPTRRPPALLLPISPRRPRLRTLLRLLLLRRGRIPGALRGNTGRGRGTRAVTCCCRRLHVAQRTERRHARPCLEATSGFGLHVFLQWVIQPAACTVGSNCISATL